MSGMAPWAAMRSLTRDPAVTAQPLSRGVTRRIIGYARPYRAAVIIFIAVVVVEALLVVAQPLMFKRIVDAGITAGNTGIVVQSAGIVALLALASAGVAVIQRLLSARIGEGLIYDLRTEVFAHVQRQPIGFFTRTQTGALVARLNSDVLGAQQAFTSTLSGVVGNSITLVVVLAAMLDLSWSLTLICLVLLPVFLLPARWTGRRLQALTREQMTLNSDVNQLMTERFNVAGALLVKLFGDPRTEDAQFAQRAAALREIGVRTAMSTQVFFVSLGLVASIATAIVYGFGGLSVISGALTLGTLLALVALLARLYLPLTALSSVRLDVMTALVSFDRVFEVLDRPLTVRDPAPPAPVPAGPLTLAFHAVDFTYPTASEISLASLESVAIAESRPDEGRPVLRDLTFTVPAGSMTALVGPSGAGKTTIGALAARLYDPTAGAITLNGVDLRAVTGADLHRAIGVVTQDPHMFHDTVRANLRYARPDAEEADLWEAMAAARIDGVIAALPNGLDTVIGDRGHRLSGGEKQRLAIARLLLQAPRVVVLDEATAHLDSENEAAVQLALRTALAGRTSLVIAHRLSTIHSAAQILVIDDGRIAQSGTHRSLLTQPGLYRTLHETQFAQPAAEVP